MFDKPISFREAFNHHFGANITDEPSLDIADEFIAVHGMHRLFDATHADIAIDRKSEVSVYYVRGAETKDGKITGAPVMFNNLEFYAFPVVAPLGEFSLGNQVKVLGIDTTDVKLRIRNGIITEWSYR